MSKTLYEEAIADTKQLINVAENNAKQAVLEAITPRIKEMIEKQLLGEDLSDDDDMLADLASNDVASSGISTPDAEGKVTLDLDALKTDAVNSEEPVLNTLASESVDDSSSDSLLEGDEEEFELTSEAIQALLPMFNASATDDKVELKVLQLGESVHKLQCTSPIIKRSTMFNSKIDETLSQIEDMYSYVRENVLDETKRSHLENKLETYYKDLKECNMDKGRKNVKENAVMVKLSGLPDEMNVEDLDIDLLSDDGEPLGGDEEVSPEGDEMAGDMDMAPGDGMEEPVEDVSDSDELETEGEELSDDTMVEIDEAMLRKEIARMKKINEVDASVLDDFGGGADEGDAWLDGEVTTESVEDDEEPSVKAESKDLKEAAVLKAENANLRKQLTEMNLFNAKLLYTNKLLQKEGITSKQKVAIIEQLDGTKSVREAKLVYESLCKTLLANAKTVTEAKKANVVGSSSKVVKAGSSTLLSESTEASRWAKLAGIVSK